MEVVLKKIQNSYRGGLTIKETEEHLRIIAKEIPKWLTFCEIRNEMYIRMARDMELADVTKVLDDLAESKNKFLSK
jgi:chromatin licensing and DNA replication factor 1